MKILAIIPARGGSKRVRHKNIVDLLGKPLIGYTLEAALAAPSLSQGNIVLSTDDEAIAAVGRDYGVNVPFLRPAELATDNAKSIDVVRHALSFMEQANHCTYDAVLLLQPTTPLRISDDIETAINIYTSQQADSLISMYELEAKHPYHMFELIEGVPQRMMSEADTYIKQRHAEFPPYYLLNGAIYLTSRDVIVSQGFYGNRLRALVMPAERSVNIDGPVDLAQAEALLRVQSAGQS